MVALHLAQRGEQLRVAMLHGDVRHGDRLRPRRATLFPPRIVKFVGFLGLSRAFKGVSHLGFTGFRAF